jgi:hypothetical protein
MIFVTQLNNPIRETSTNSRLSRLLSPLFNCSSERSYKTPMSSISLESIMLRGVVGLRFNKTEKYLKTNLLSIL